MTRKLIITITIRGAADRSEGRGAGGPLAVSARACGMDAAAILAQEEDDLEDFDLSQGMSQDLVDYEDMSPLPSPAKPVAGVPTASTAAVATAPAAPAGAPAPAAPIDDDRDLLALEAEIDAAADAAAAPERAGKRARSPAPEPMDADEHQHQHQHQHEPRAEAPALDDANPPRAPLDAPDDTLADDTLADVEMRDQHTFVPLEPAEVVLVERICRRVREPKKHLVRLLVKQFGSALAEGALRETERVEREGGSFFEADGKPPRRRSPGGTFIAVVKSRAPEADFKRVMRRSAEIDKLLRKQREASDGGRGPPQKRRRVGIEARLEGLGGDEGGIDATARGGGGGRGGGRGRGRSRGRGRGAGGGTRHGHPDRGGRGEGGDARVNDAYATDV